MRVTRVSAQRPIEALMTREIVTARPGTTLAEAAARMRERRVGAVLILDGPRVAGILTERDLLGAVAEDADPETTPCDRYMTAGPVTIEPSASLAEATELMVRNRIRHLPVEVPDMGVVGIVSVRDLVAEHATRAHARKAREPW